MRGVAGKLGASCFTDVSVSSYLPFRAVAETENRDHHCTPCNSISAELAITHSSLPLSVNLSHVVRPRGWVYWYQHRLSKLVTEWPTTAPLLLLLLNCAE